MTDVSGDEVCCPTLVQPSDPLQLLKQGNVCGRHSVLIARGLEVLSNCLSNSCPTHPPTLRESNKCLKSSAEQGSTGTATVVGIYYGIYCADTSTVHSIWYLQRYLLSSLVDTERANVHMATLPDQKFVVLLRVSTHSQGADGHGVAAQRRDIQIFLDGLDGSPEVIQEFVEVE